MKLIALHEDLASVKAKIANMDSRIARNREAVLGKANSWWDRINKKYSAPGAYESESELEHAKHYERQVDERLKQLDPAAREQVENWREELWKVWNIDPVRAEALKTRINNALKMERF